MADKTELAPEVAEKVNAAKMAGHVAQAVVIAGTKYIYRSINRAEYRKLQAQLTNEAEEAKKNLPEDQLEKEALAIRDRGEDRLVELGLIHPQAGENAPAGVVSTIADLIMQASGFGFAEEPEVL